MQDQFPFIDSITLPVDAPPGSQRVFITPVYSHFGAPSVPAILLEDEVIFKQAADIGVVVSDSVTGIGHLSIEGPQGVRNQIGHGPIEKDIITTNSPVFSSSSDTTLACINVPQVAGYTYEIHVHVLVDFTGGAWDLQLEVNNVVEDTFWRLGAITGQQTVDATVEWEATTTGTTDDFILRATELLGAGTVQLLADATHIGFLSIKSIGIQS
jgi:hypothetical protein